MNVTLNKKVSIFISCSVIGLYTMGLFPIYKAFGFFYLTSNEDPSWTHLVLANLIWMITNLSELIVGFWLFFYAEKLKQDKWTWMTMGFLYDKYALVLILIIVIVQNIAIKNDLFKSVYIIVIAIPLILLLKTASQPLLTYFVTRSDILSNVGLITLCSKYLAIVMIIIVFFMNIFLAIKLSHTLKSFAVTGKAAWIFATLTLGVFTLILFNQLIVIKEREIALSKNQHHT